MLRAIKISLVMNGDEPAIDQHQFSETVRTSWNPDDNRLYVEVRNEHGDWLAKRTNANTPKGFWNTTQHARRLAKEEAERQP